VDGETDDGRGDELNVKLRGTTALGTTADEDSDLPGDVLRTSHANDVGLYTTSHIRIHYIHTPQFTCSLTYYHEKDQLSVAVVIQHSVTPLSSGVFNSHSQVILESFSGL